MNKLLFIPMLLILLASCMTELEQMPAATDNDAPKRVFHASIEGTASNTQTKVYADEDMKVVWNAGDMISIYEQTTYNHPYQFDGDDGDTAGDFIDLTPSGYHTGNQVPYNYAAYPYSKANKLSNKGVFTLTLPAEQSYKANSFGIGANTMVAVTDNDFLAFKNVGGYLSLRLYGDDVSVRKVTLKANNGEKIAGKGLVTIPLGGLPTVEMDATGTDEITIICDPAVKIGPDAEHYTSFWFVIPPVTFEKGFTVTVTDDKDGEYTVATSKPFTVSRNKLDWMTAVKVVPNYTNAAVNFDDEDFEAYCLQHFDTNNDGVISKSEAAAVEEIDVCTDNISSLGGIEYFTGLKSLKCAGSGIATRSGNSDFTGQLESIELGSLILLEELDCHENNLEELDLSGNPNLDNVDCTNNPMTVIHLAPGQVIPTLESPEDTQIVHDWGDGIGPESFPDPEFRAYVFENIDTDNNGFLSEQECDAVTSIDVDTENISSLQGIEYFVNLEDLFCRLNNWSTLKKYFNTETHEWHMYDANDNEVIGSLSSLDVSSNTSLKRLYCIGNQLTSIDVSNNTALTVLNCSYNQIESLNVSNNVALTYLDCSCNQIESLNVSNNVALTFLSCSLNYVESLDVSDNTALTTFYCDYNQLGSIDVSNNSALTAFSCRSTQLETIDVSNNTSLSRFWCDYNQLTSLDISNNVSLTQLYCDYNQLTSLDVSNNPALTNLSCSNSTMQYLYLMEGQEIARLSKHNNTTIVYKSPNPVPADEIWYTSTTENVIEPCEWGGGFGEASIVSNTYADGKGIIKFDRPLIQIGTSAFAECNFKTVILPEGLTTIGSYAFGYCQRMTSITFPSTLASIGGHAIRDCYSLTSVAIPNSVETIGAGAFDNCRSLQSFNGKYASNDHRWLIIDGSLIGFAPLGLTSITIPSGVTEIETYTFHHCSNLISVIIPEGVTRIGGSAFSGCSSLTTVSIPESMETIESGAFSQCYSMTAFNGKYASEDGRCLVVDGATVGFAPYGLLDYTIPSSVTNIDYSTFSNCSSLRSITVPASVTSIGEYAFQGCSSLQSITFDSATPPAFNSVQVPTAIFDYTNNCPIYVPASSVDAYKHMQETSTWGGWARYADRIQPRATIPEVVDLGLSVKWASFNLGATTPEEYGDYFAWGETQPYYINQDPLTWKQGKESGYAFGSYKFNPSGDGETFTKYTGSDYDNLQPEDDAATVNLGGNWRMATKSEWSELYSNCNWEWVEDFNNSGHNGYLVTSRKEGFTDKSIFLPAGDEYMYRKYGNGGPDFELGFCGDYWTSTLYVSPDVGATRRFYSNTVGSSGSSRSYGLSVRPVLY